VKLPDLKKLFKKKEEEEISPELTKPVQENLPSDLEQFKVEKAEPTFTPQPVTRSSIEERYSGDVPQRMSEPAPITRTPIAETPEKPVGDRIDMILQKLETIDTRLKLIEERMK